MRTATSADIYTYYHWANDSDVRLNAINKSAINFEDHKLWFERKLSNDNSRLFFFEYLNSPIGQVRIDSDGKGEFMITYSIDSAYRNMGFGYIVLKLALKQFTKNIFDRIIIKALVKLSNVASEKIFINLNFTYNQDIAIDNEIFREFKKIIN